MDTLGGPMGPWDRWDLGTDGTWASRTPDTSSEDTSSELFIDTQPARPGRPSLQEPSPNHLACLVRRYAKILRPTLSHCFAMYDFAMLRDIRKGCLHAAGEADFGNVVRIVLRMFGFGMIAL